MLNNVFFWLALLFVFSPSLQADDLSNFTFSPAEFNKQFSQKTIRQIYQDKTGYLWLAAQEGVSRYDGYQLLTFLNNPRQSESLSSNKVRAILEDPLDRLWIATEGGGLNLYNPARQNFNHIQHDANNKNSLMSNDIRSMILDSSGVFWLGYATGNFSRFNPNSFEFEHFNLKELQPELDSAAAISSIVEDANYLWFATEGNGLLRFHKKTQQIERFHTQSDLPFFSDNLNKVYLDTQQRLWVASEDAGVSVADPQRLKFTNFAFQGQQETSLPSNNVYTVFQDHSQQIWIGTDAGAALWNGRDKFSNFNSDNGFESNIVLSIFQDLTGLMWIGTYEGVVKGIEGPFDHFDHGLPNNDILGFAETLSNDDEYNVWAATYGGLARLNNNGEVEQVINKDSTPALLDARITAIKGDKNILWFGTRGTGLGRLNVDTQEIDFFVNESDNPVSLSSNLVTSIFIDKAGNTWIGTFGGGLNYLPHGSDEFVHYRFDKDDSKSLNSDKVLAVYQLHDGSIVVGTLSGINVLNPISLDFHRIAHSPDNLNGLSAHSAWAFYQDKKAQMWVGTREGGLNKWSAQDISKRRNHFTHYNSSNGQLVKETIYSILDDDNGNLWLSGTSGLTRLNKQTGKVRHFDNSQGLKDSEFNFAAGFKDRNGFMYFGGNSGIVRFHPDDIRESTVIPPVVMVRIKKLNEQVWFDVSYQQLQQLELNYKDYFISFEFAALDFNAPELNEYRYKLDGLDTGWIELENRRTATFTNLPAGEYVLRAQASNNNGLWNTQGVSLPIKVLPPPWKTAWAYTLYIIIVFIIILYFIWLYRRKRLREVRLMIELEEKVEDRTKELLHANAQLEISMQETEKARRLAEQASKEKSDFLAIMSHEIRTPMNGVLGMTEVLLSSDLKPKQHHFAQLVYRSGRLLLDLLNNILDFSKLEAGKTTLESVTVDLEALIEEVCDLFSEAAYNKGIQINAILSPEPLPLVYADPARLRQIIANLTSNAIKFTERGEVNISVKRVACHQVDSGHHVDLEERGGFEICVQDTGIGMAPDRQQKVFEMFTQADASTTRKYGGTGLGLAICKQLTALMAGNINVQSNVGEGSRFSLEVDLPLSEVHQIEDDSLLDCPTVHMVNLSPGLGRAVTSMLMKLNVSAVHVNRVNAKLPSAKNGLWISSSEYESAIQEASIPSKNWICLLPSSQWQENDVRNILPLPVHLNELLKSLQIALGYESQNQSMNSGDHRNHQKFNANILVAEDSLTNQEVAKSMLGLLGCDTWLADNGAEAVEQVNLHQPDLVLMDCQMPIMDGYKATQAIRKNWPDIPIVALTAGIGDNLHEQCLNAGMNEVMTKPFSLLELEQTLLRFLAVPRHTTQDSEQKIETNQTASDDKTDELEIVKKATSDQPLIEISTVQTLLKISKDTGNPVFARVLDAFTQEAEKLIQQLNDQVNNPPLDLHAISDTAHALKSMAGNSGAKALYELCKELETQSKLQQAKDVNELATKIQATFVVSCQTLETFRDAN